MRCRLAIVAALAALARAAIAEPARVEVRAMPGDEVPAGMVDTLRIHLGGAATITVGAPLVGETLPQRIDEASGGLAAGALVTWLEPGGERGAYVVVIVGERDGRAAVEVGHLDSDDPSAVSRLLALRVAAFLDETIAAGPGSPVAVTPIAAVIATPRRAALRAIAEVGGGAESDGRNLHSDGSLSIGARRTAAAGHLEVVATGRFGWPRRQRTATGQISLGVIDVGVGVRWLAPLGSGWLGVAAEIGARRVRADAMDAGGAAGAVVRWLPRARAGLDARMAVGPSMTLRAWLGAERGLEIERFTVHGQATADVGALAATGALSVVFQLGRP